VANLSVHELPYISRIMVESDFARRLQAHPILKRLVSANVVGQFSFAPYLIRELMPRSPAGVLSKPIRIAFIGLTEPSAVISKEFRITDPIEAAKRAVAEAKRQADLVILLAHVKTGLAARLAREVAGIDIIIAGNGEYFTPPFRSGQTLVLFTASETRMLGEIRFYQTAAGRIATKVRYISLDEQIPQDAIAMLLIRSMRDALKASEEQTAKLLAQLAADAAHRDHSSLIQAEYISAQSCGKCHLPQYMRWVNSAHAHTTDRLVSMQNQFDAGCLSCHATGKGSAILPDVQCEQCHGPAADHLLKPGKGYGHIADLKALCSACHTKQINPTFNVQASWAKIKH
jgi:hypothetical protein